MQAYFGTDLPDASNQRKLISTPITSPLPIVSKDAVIEIDDPTDLFSGNLSIALKECPQEYLTISESDFVEQHRPTSIDWLLRKRFWECVNQARSSGISEITQSSIYDGIISKQNFIGSVITNPMRVAWMMRPLTDHLQVCGEIVDIGLQKIREYLQVTKVTEKNASQMLRLVEFCMNRHYGPLIQKLAIHQKTEVSNNPSARDVSSDATPQLLLDKLSEISDKLTPAIKNEDTAKD